MVNLAVVFGLLLVVALVVIGAAKAIAAAFPYIVGVALIGLVILACLGSKQDK